MSPILDAIAAIDAQGPNAQICYSKFAKMFNVDRVTLTRRHRRETRSYAAAQQQRMLLNPQQEEELVIYIKRLADQGLAPTREMIKNFASVLACWEPSESWVSRFLRRHSDALTAKYTSGIDRVRFNADSEHRYKLYFDLLFLKIQEYDIAAENTYNMDEKGFAIGIISRAKRVFSKVSWSHGKVKQALQDGNREWITILATICADGSSIPPALIFEGMGALHTSWVDAIECGKHRVFCATSLSGWSNNDLGLAWLEQVFDRSTKVKARGKWRLLIVDGHQSHLTPEFLQYCELYMILLMVFPPYATHSLQPLDVVMFSPLATAYLKALAEHLHRSQGLIPVRKGDFFELFWLAYTQSFTSRNILKAFEATGIEPRDATVVTNRFKTPPQQGDEVTKINDGGDGNTWNEVRHLFDRAVADKAKVEAKRLEHALHSFQVQNELLHHENDSLKAALATKKRHNKKSKPLELHQRDEFHGGAVFYSPRKIREGRVRDAVKQREAAAEQLLKSEQREIKRMATIYNKQMAEARKVERMQRAEVKKKERKARAAALAAARAEKQRQRDAATLQKSRNTPNKRPRTTSRKDGSIAAKRRRIVGAASGDSVASPPPPAPPKQTSRGRNINVPSKYK